MMPKPMYRLYEEGKEQGDEQRLDYGKDPWHLLCWDAVKVVVEIFGFGAQKYKPRGWESGMEYSRMFSAMQRHATKFWEGENIDPDSGKHHLGHVAWNALCLLAYELRGVGTDDRPRTK